MAKTDFRGIRRRLEAYAEENGWKLDMTTGQHFKLTKPGTKPVFVSSSPSCHRAIDNAISDLRRADRQIAEAAGN